MVQICKQAEADLIRLRRELHAVPEIGGQLPLTKQIVCRRLDELNIPYRLNEGDDGIVAEIKGTCEGKNLAFRADMDGLHIDEVTNVPYKSTIPGQMHGCGHDAHTAIALAAAEVLLEHRAELKGTVRILFQTGEETGTGAKQMLAEGALEGVDAICAIHVGNLAGDTLPAGSLVITPGAVSAGKDKFTITVKGKGTHTAFPEKGIDPILIAARIVNACEELAARELPVGTAAVLSFGSIHAGTDHNTIPGTAVLKGGIRAQDVAVRDFLGQRLETIAANIAAAFRGECEVDIKRGSATVINDPDLAALAGAAVSEVLGTDSVFTAPPAPLMGSDDFANYASRISGLYFFLCTNNPDKGIVQANHNPAFDVDETVLWKGAAALAAIAIQYLR